MNLDKKQIWNYVFFFLVGMCLMLVTLPLIQEESVRQSRADVKISAINDTLYAVTDETFFETAEQRIKSKFNPNQVGYLFYQEEDNTYWMLLGDEDLPSEERWVQMLIAKLP